jgi:hypothetical protein
MIEHDGTIGGTTQDVIRIPVISVVSKEVGGQGQLELISDVRSGLDLVRTTELIGPPS